MGIGGALLHSLLNQAPSPPSLLLLHYNPLSVTLDLRRALDGGGGVVRRQPGEILLVSPLGLALLLFLLLHFTLFSIMLNYLPLLSMLEFVCHLV